MDAYPFIRLPFSSSTLSGSGDKPYTITGTDNANTGDSNRTETGTDTYDLTQSGIASGASFSLALTGSDGYETDSGLNTQSGAFSTSTTGTGTYSKTDLLATTTTTGTTSFSSTEIGASRDADVVLTTSGTSRYDQLIGFNNTSDGGNGTAGIADSSPVGLPVMVGRASGPAGVFSSIGDARYEYCFAAGTKILLADHPPRNIEDMEEGLRVMAAPDTDPEAMPTPCHVLQVFRNAPAPIWHVQVAGELIRTTANHPFCERSKGWIAAARLQAGDELRTFDGRWIAVESVRDSGAVEPVFNLQVEGNHTYFVIVPNSETALLVHNDSANSNNGDMFIAHIPESETIAQGDYRTFGGVRYRAIAILSSPESSSRFAFSNFARGGYDVALSPYVLGKALVTWSKPQFYGPRNRQSFTEVVFKRSTGNETQDMLAEVDFMHQRLKDFALKTIEANKYFEILQFGLPVVATVGGAAVEIRGITVAAENAATPQATARAFYKAAGWSDERIASHLAGVDFGQPVEVVTIPKGTQVMQYQIPGNPTGNYFAPLGTSAESIGVNPAGRVANIYTTTSDVTVLRSTAASTASNPNLPASVRGAGGGIQYFAPNTSAFGQ